VLLQSLRPTNDHIEPPTKKRKTHNNGTFGDTGAEITSPTQVQNTSEPLELLEEVEGEEIIEHEDHESDSDDEEVLLQDPFQKHYSRTGEEPAIKNANDIPWTTTSVRSDSDVRTTLVHKEGSSSNLPMLRTVEEAHLKHRLLATGRSVIAGLPPEAWAVAGPLFNYTDVVNGVRNSEIAPALRDLACLHALNHVFKTRDRVLKNTSKLSDQAGSEALDLRDQGFTRPKVLMMLPTKQACVRFVDSIVKLSKPEQQENKARFLETYSLDKDEWQDKPDDFRELFGGNHEEDFRIGLKYTRKTIKFFSGFYNSDIIIGSPLGLMRTITTGGGGKEQKKVQDSDFLSSIEILIMDHANALQMQNWQHVEYVFSQLNLLPKDSHGCDFSRVRHWYLDGQAKRLRQTIILSDYLTPEINSLVTASLHNVAGRVKHVPTYPGAMLGVSSLALPYTTGLTQTFLRITSPTYLLDSDSRFKFFTTTILPPLVRDAKHQRGVLLFIPSYADFVRLRNYLSTSSDTTSLSFGSISEYTPVKEVMRARSHFLSGRHSLLLYTERAHHHFRYRIKGVKKILWYSAPENPIFWTEVISLLGMGSALGAKDRGISTKGVVRAMFSKWDALKLERIVGTERVGRLLLDKGGDTFEFV
jgi:U3 small nucleolar RNA-associated protein 25